MVKVAKRPDTQKKPLAKIPSNCLIEIVLWRNKHIERGKKNQGRQKKPAAKNLDFDCTINLWLVSHYTSYVLTF